MRIIVGSKTGPTARDGISRRTRLTVREDLRVGRRRGEGGCAGLVWGQSNAINAAWCFRASPFLHTLDHLWTSAQFVLETRTTATYSQSISEVARGSLTQGTA